MATLKHNKYGILNSKGKSSFYGVYTFPASIFSPKVYFKTALDDVYGEHVVFGDEAKKRKEISGE